MIAHPINDNHLNSLLENWVAAKPLEDCFLFETMIHDYATKNRESFSGEEEKAAKEHLQVCPYCNNLYLDAVEDLKTPLSDKESEFIRNSLTGKMSTVLSALIENYAKKINQSAAELIKDVERLLSLIMADNNRLYDISHSVTIAGCSTEDAAYQFEPSSLDYPIKEAGLMVANNKDIFLKGSFSKNHEACILITHISPKKEGHKEKNVSWEGEFDKHNKVYVAAKRIPENKRSLRIKIGEINKTSYSLNRLVDIDKTRLIILI